MTRELLSWLNRGRGQGVIVRSWQLEHVILVEKSPLGRCRDISPNETVSSPGNQLNKIKVGWPPRKIRFELKARRHVFRAVICRKVFCKFEGGRTNWFFCSNFYQLNRNFFDNSRKMASRWGRWHKSEEIAFFRSGKFVGGDFKGTSWFELNVQACGCSLDSYALFVSVTFLP